MIVSTFASSFDGVDTRTPPCHRESTWLEAAAS
jgi:hypothetical protein